MGSRVALYVRVSSGAQVESGHGLEGQHHDLRQNAERERREIVAEVVDPARKRADLERPGLNELRQIAAAGEIDEVWAWAWDRYGEYPVPEIFAWEMERMGVKLRSLDDGGENLGGEIMRAVGGVLSREDQRKRVARSQMGKASLARKGKIMGKPAPAYGYEFNAARDAYVVDEERMEHVRRILRETADGASVHSIVDRLRHEGIVTRHGKHISRTVVRRIVLSNLYKPHTVGELRGLGVAEHVLGRVDPEAEYGVSYYQDIPVPVPDAGIPREVVASARERMGQNRQFSQAGDRTWELSGGTMRCASCGWRMSTTTVNRASGKVDYYYRCSKAFGQKDCPNRKTYNAETHEALVWDTVGSALNDPEILLERVSEDFARQRGELSASHLDTERLYKELETVQNERKGYLKQNARGVLPDEELDGFLGELDRKKAELEEVLETARTRDERLAWIARDEADIREFIQRGEFEDFYHDALPEERQSLYRRYRLNVEGNPDGTLSLTWLGDQPVVSSESSRPPECHRHPAPLSSPESALLSQISRFTPGIRTMS